MRRVGSDLPHSCLTTSSSENEGKQAQPEKNLPPEVSLQTRPVVGEAPGRRMEGSLKKKGDSTFPREPLADHRWASRRSWAAKEFAGATF
ncbi:unnamed protein product [Linum trigynum]|uniref:Uncharacterized protein n=1 Tax=Linum trigynum TaxID=586398 RepID=A0AAV2G781_9ROSI